jgi:hypothetical protein
MVYPLVLKTQHDRKSFSFQDASLQTLPVLGFSVIKTISGQLPGDPARCNAAEKQTFQRFSRLPVRSELGRVLPKNS